MNIPLEEIGRIGGALLAEGIRRMRSSEIEIAAGYDGEYGAIRLFSKDERERFSTQLGFFEQNKIAQAHFDDLPAHELKINEQTAKYSSPETDAAEENRPPKTPPKVEAPKTDDHPLLKNLNARQRQAVISNSSALMIVAGPGAGKTATLTRRIAYLIDQNLVPPENILAITFTNKAAEEMRQRLRAWAGPRATEKMAVQTFHALGALILKEEGARLGYRAGFTILGESERARFLKTLQNNLSDKESAHYLSLISHAKNLLLDPPASSTHEDFKEATQFAELYSAYQSELIKNHCVDFDDLIFLPVQLFEQFPEVAAKYQQRFQWLFVDEYQDVNFAQYRLLRQLAAPQNRLCVIGDPDQAIYGFRGARREFFLRFRDEFPAAEIVHLDKSYRSPQFILEAAAQMIAAGAEAQTKVLVSDILREGKVHIYRAASDKAEAEFVVHEIEKMVGGTSYFSLDSGRVVEHEPAASVNSFADFAVLYRLHSQSRLLEEAFSRSGIPFQIIGETPFYERAEIKSAIAFLKFLHNPESDLHLQELLFDKNFGISETIAQQIVESAREKQASLWSALTNTPSQKKAVAKLVEKIKAVRERLPGKTVAEMIETVVANFFDKENMNEKTRAGFDRLILQARPFCGRVDEFLQMAAVSAAADEYDPRSARVALMTLHAAKGLEFPVVFIVGCEENLFPYLKTAAPAELEEERRLLYVGMTRAKEKLILVHAGSRFLFGEKMQNAPSRFLNDIENRLKEFAEMRLAPKTAPAAPAPNPQLSLF
jgi:DNA helicase-2/ATP-dependent DNA helicase PcrA